MAHVIKEKIETINSNGWKIIEYKWKCCANNCGKLFDKIEDAGHCHDY